MFGPRCGGSFGRRFRSGSREGRFRGRPGSPAEAGVQLSEAGGLGPGLRRETVNPVGAFGGYSLRLSCESDGFGLVIRGFERIAWPLSAVRRRAGA